MNNPVLQEEYARLRAQLAEAYSAPQWQSGQIDRLANALAAVERQLASLAPGATWRELRPTPSPTSSACTMTPGRDGGVAGVSQGR